MLRHYADGAFSNRHLNWLNLHLGLVNFGQILRLQISGIFFLKMGLSVSQVCFLMGALIGLRFLFRTPLIYIPHKFGSKAALIIGQIMLALAFALFAYSGQPGPVLWFAILLMSAGEALYWHAVHTTFATLAEHGKFGRQLSARALFMSAGSLCAPLATGLVEQVSGWSGIYILATIVLLMSLVPLFFMPEPCPPQPIDVRKGLAVNKAGMKLFAGWGASSAIMAVIWPMIVYFQFGTVQKFAGMMATTTLISILISIFVARRIDLGKGRNVVVYGAVAYAFIVLLLAATGTDPTRIALISACLNICASSYTQPFNASLYKWAKETHDPLWFHYWSEFGWDLGNLAVLWSIGAILSFAPELNLRWTMLVILPTLLWCYAVYATDGRLLGRRRQKMEVTTE